MQAGGEVNVRICEQNEVTLNVLQSGLHGVVLAKPTGTKRRIVDGDDSAVFGGDPVNDARSVIVRVVIDDDYLEVGVGLGQERTQAGLDIFRLIPSRYDHGD